MFTKGFTPWNKGTKGLIKPNSGNFKKGQTSPNKGKKTSDETKEKQRFAKLGKKNNSNTKFVKGNPSWNKGIHIPKIAKENSPHWKGGITPENRRIRTSLEYRLWRKSCFERDNFTCQKTGQYGGNLCVHHINNFSEFEELQTSISNGITLSKKCHKEFHKLYGRKNNTIEQFNEFLTLE